MICMNGMLDLQYLELNHIAGLEKKPRNEISLTAERLTGTLLEKKIVPLCTMH